MIFVPVPEVAAATCAAATHKGDLVGVGVGLVVQQAICSIFAGEVQAAALDFWQLPVSHFPCQQQQTCVGVAVGGLGVGVAVGIGIVPVAIPVTIAEVGVGILVGVGETHASLEQP